MKKLFLLLFIILCLSACTKEGEIQNKSTKHIQINGKEYYFIKVVPADGERAVWLLVPRDSKVEFPQSISYNYTTGGKHRTTHNLSCIWIKS